MNFVLRREFISSACEQKALAIMTTMTRQRNYGKIVELGGEMDNDVVCRTIFEFIAHFLDTGLLTGHTKDAFDFEG